MGRYFTTIITAYVVSSSLQSYSGFDPCVGGLLFRAADIPVLPLNITSPPTCHYLLFLFPNLLWEKKQYHWTIFGKRCTIGRGLVQIKNTLSSKAHCRLVTGFKPLFISEKKAWFLTQVNQQNSVILHWSTLNRVGSSHSNMRQAKPFHHGKPDKNCRDIWTPRTWQKRALLLLKSVPFLCLQNVSKVSSICQKYTKKVYSWPSLQKTH